jgi:hypothetical protein
MFAMILLVVAVIAEHGETKGRVIPESRKRLCSSSASRRTMLFGAAVLGAAPLADSAVRKAFAGQQPTTAEGSGESASGLLANGVPLGQNGAARR